MQPWCIKTQIQNAGIIASPGQLIPHAASPNFYKYFYMVICHCLVEQENKMIIFTQNLFYNLVSFSISGVLVRQSQNQVDTFCVLVCSNSLMQFSVPTSEQSLLFYVDYQAAKVVSKFNAKIEVIFKAIKLYGIRIENHFSCWDWQFHINIAHSKCWLQIND